MDNKNMVMLVIFLVLCIFIAVALPFVIIFGLQPLSHPAISILPILLSVVFYYVIPRYVITFILVFLRPIKIQQVRKLNPDEELYVKNEITKLRHAALFFIGSICLFALSSFIFYLIYHSHPDTGSIPLAIIGWFLLLSAITGSVGFFVYRYKYSLYRGFRKDLADGVVRLEGKAYFFSKPNKAFGISFSSYFLFMGTHMIKLLAPEDIFDQYYNQFQNQNVYIDLSAGSHKIYDIGKQENIPQQLAGQ